MVADVQPVAYLLAVAVDRQRLARLRVGDDQRDQLLREMVGAVVVGAVGGQRRHAVGVVVRAHQMVGRCLRRRVRAVRRIGRGFAERCIVRAQRAVHLVGGHVQEAEGAFCCFRQCAPVGARRFQQAEGAVDISLDECARAMDRTVHMAFRRKVHDGARLMLLEQRQHLGLIADIATHKLMAAVLLQRRQIIKVARIGELIEIEHRLVRLGQPIQYKIRTDEPGTACHKNHLVSRAVSQISRNCDFM